MSLILLMIHLEKQLRRYLMINLISRDLITNSFQGKPGFHMIATVGDAWPRQARGHIGDDFVKWKHFLNDVADVADQTGTVRGRIERVEMSLKPGFHMIVTVGDASPRQARGQIGDGCVKWEHFLNDVADVTDQTGVVRGRFEKVEMSLKRGFHMIITVIVSICRRLIGDTSPMCRSRSPTVTIIWKPG